MDHIKNLSSELENEVNIYQEIIDKDLGIVYDKRRAYEEAVQLINIKVSAMLDQKQKDAQRPASPSTCSYERSWTSQQ